ncbi:Fic family protein [Portibacter marinus]|uniref:Fic family protein n=1 Tax=Portibacter marinus TaxID=2898660 RepID=UPI0038733419
MIKSCVFHYEMETIHPFMDGNERMARLWQTIIMMKKNPLLEFLPNEEKVRNTQSQYYIYYQYLINKEYQLYLLNICLTF